MCIYVHICICICICTFICICICKCICICIWATVNIWHVALSHHFFESVLSFHCILMLFQQRVKYFLTLSNAAQSCETLGHSFFFMELTPPLAQPPLSYHYRQQPLSPTTVATTASTPSHEILIFTSSTLNFEGSL